MKNIFIILALCFPMFAVADESCTTNTSEETVDEVAVISTNVPKFLEGATITVRTKDGRESTVSAEKFKVVPRAQQFVVTKTSKSASIVCRNADKNRITILGGNGPKGGLSRTQNSASQVTIENNTGTVLGAQYQRELGFKVFGLPVHGGVQYQNNETLSGGAGVSW